MENPFDLLAALVERLSTIGGLLLELAPGDPILAFDEAAPTRRNLQEAIDALVEDQLLVAYRQTSSSSGVWQHTFMIFLRPSSAAKVYRVFERIINGVPSGAPVPLQYAQIHEACESGLGQVDWVPQLNQDGVEIWALTFALTERGA